MTNLGRIAPWQVWWADLDPTEGKEQAGNRPVLVVSSTFHLRLTAGVLVTVLPMTTRERPGWLHHVRVTLPGGRISYVMAEQTRTVARARLTGDQPVTRLDADEIAMVRDALGRMLDA